MPDKHTVTAAWLAARQREREHLSQILHDDVAGGLTAVGLSLDLLSLDLPPELADRVSEIQSRLELSFQSVRELSHEFHPDPGVRFGLAQALSMLVRRFERRFQGTVDLRIDAAVAEATLRTEQSRGLYAIAEAALHNVERHARASTVAVALAASGGRLGPTLSIRDNGVGFVPAQITPGTGSSVMGYHIQTGCFDLTIETVAGSGTLVQVACKRAPRSTGQVSPGRA
ncbi:MAG: hypothetical protein IT162_14990 [Bryobacterales bacterium]|nr:hypothetical protein [Bryobacterales bacterium]